MTEILLATLNARFSHASLGLRYLLANLGELRERAALREFTIHDAPAAVAERLIAEQPAVIGFGVYIWNLRETTQVVGILKRVAPQVRIVIGGPEVSHESQHERIVELADVLITGEADLTFPAVCADLLAGKVPGVDIPRTVRSPKPDPALLTLPYGLYSDADLAHRLIYVEASRGCPFTCEFCLSSVDNGVRNFPLDGFLAAMDALLTRGCRTFKFVDRTFNLSPRVASAILEFFLARLRPQLFLHFEMVPDRLPDAVKALIPRFPAGCIQFEIGIQSFTPLVGELISRRMDRARTEANLRWLRDHTSVHIHADLIIGLPGETLATLAESFDALWFLRPQEIQIGILKLLKGTPIARHRDEYRLVFNPDPPYDLLQNRDFDFAAMQRMKRFARYFELFVNRERFADAVELVAGAQASPFRSLLAFADWLWAETGQEHAFSLQRQYELLARYLGERIGLPEERVIATLAGDFLRHGARKYLPEFLRPAVESARRGAAAPRAAPHDG